MMETFWYLKIFSHSVYFGFLVSNLANLISKSKSEIDMSHGKKVWPNTCMVKPSNILRILNLRVFEKSVRSSKTWSGTWLLAVLGRLVKRDANMLPKTRTGL